MTEKQLQAAILKRHGSRTDVRLFRNESGVYWCAPRPDAPRVSAGLCKGSADLIGIKYTNRDDSPCGIFVALEVKVGKNQPTPEQDAFIRMIVRFGGIAGVVRSIEQSDMLLGEPS